MIDGWSVPDDETPTKCGSESAIGPVGDNSSGESRRCASQIRESNVIGPHVEIILIVTGAVTALALMLFIAPSSVLRMAFGAAPTDVVSIAVVRHWGLVIFLIGLMLIYAAFYPAVRDPAMVVAAVEKLILGVGVFGTSLRSRPVAAAIAAGDSLMGLVYLLYLAGF
jgi:hypothetical protein